MAMMLVCKSCCAEYRGIDDHIRCHWCGRLRTVAGAEIREVRVQRWPRVKYWTALAYVHLWVAVYDVLRIKLPRLV